MRVRRLRPEETKGFCFGCHNRAVIHIDINEKRPPLRLCAHCGRYLSIWVGKRLDEHDKGLPVPEPRPRDDESRGNR